MSSQPDGDWLELRCKTMSLMHVLFISKDVTRVATGNVTINSWGKRPVMAQNVASFLCSFKYYFKSANYQTTQKFNWFQNEITKNFYSKENKKISLPIDYCVRWVFSVPGSCKRNMCSFIFEADIWHCYRVYWIDQSQQLNIKLKLEKACSEENKEWKIKYWHNYELQLNYSSSNKFCSQNGCLLLCDGSKR